MNRYYLDTNIVIFLVFGELDNLSKEVGNILSDFNNQLLVSAISISELVQLYRIKKITSKKYRTTESLITTIEKDFHIKIMPFNTNHVKTMAKLSVLNGHDDPFDHAIISQAISDKITLISSDRKFEDYTKQRLAFVFNRR